MDTSGTARVRARLEEVKHSPPATLDEGRANLDMLFGSYPLPEDTRVVPIDIGTLAAEWVSTGNVDMERVILYLHGGTYMRGSFVSHRGMAARLSAAAGARALLLGYRRAPEHPFPAALKDAVTAYRWLLAQGIVSEHIVLAGDSAGGGLSAAMLLALRDAGHPLPAGAALLSAWTDLAATGDSSRTLVDVDPWLLSEQLLTGANAYLNGVDPRNPLASPLYGDLWGLPPLLIHVGSDEILLDDSTRFAQRAETAGVQVTLKIWDGMWHVFQAFAPEVPEGQQSIHEIGAFIRECTGSGRSITQHFPRANGGVHNS